MAAAKAPNLALDAALFMGALRSGQTEGGLKQIVRAQRHEAV
jgi:hypothetical protein